MPYRAPELTESQNQWYFNLGVTDHITRNREAFYSFRDITPFPITLGDESQMVVTGKDQSV